MDIPEVNIPGPGEALGGIGGFIGGLADDAGQAIVDYVIEFIFGLIAQAVASITGALAQSFNGASTRVDLTGGWFTTESGSTVTAMTSVIAGSLVLVFLFMSLIRAMFAGEFSTMWRAAFVDVPVAFLATALTVVVASALLSMVDEASATLLGADGEQLAAFGESLTDTEQLSLAGLLGILFGLLFIIGAVLVWIQLLVRAALIYIVIAFAPITWVTRAYPGTRGIAKRGAEIAIALIVSKFVMAISFRLGAEAMASADVASGEANLAAMLTGSAIMLMTAFMPWMIFKIIPAVDSATSAAGPQSAAIGGAVVAGGLAFAGVRALASGATSSATQGGSRGGSDGPSAGGSTTGGNGGQGSDGSGGGGNGGAPGGVGGSGGGGAGLAEAVPVSDETTGDGAEPETGPSASQSSGDRETSTASGTKNSGGATGAQAYQVTPVGGSPGVGVMEIEVDSPASSSPSTQSSRSPQSEGDGTTGPQPLAGLRKRADQ